VGGVLRGRLWSQDLQRVLAIPDLALLMRCRFSKQVRADLIRRCLRWNGFLGEKLLAPIKQRVSSDRWRGEVQDCCNRHALANKQSEAMPLAIKCGDASAYVWNYLTDWLPLGVENDCHIVRIRAVDCADYQVYALVAMVL
jgi:hypothetical protein